MIIVASIQASAVGRAGQLPTLDLTQRPAAVAEIEDPAVNGVVLGRPEVVAGGIAGGESRPPLGLHITLRLDEGFYRWGEPFLYELELRNTSNIPILVPWSLDAVADPPEQLARNAGYRKLSVSLYLQLGEELLLLNETAERIVGFVNQPDTVRVVKPGDRVVIRGKGRWGVLSLSAAAKALPAQLPRELAVQAIVSLSDRPTFQDPRGSSTPVHVSMQPQ